MIHTSSFHSFAVISMSEHKNQAAEKKIMNKECFCYLVSEPCWTPNHTGFWIFQTGGAVSLSFDGLLRIEGWYSFKSRLCNGGVSSDPWAVKRSRGDKRLVQNLVSIKRGPDSHSRVAKWNNFGSPFTTQNIPWPLRPGPLFTEQVTR